VFHIAAFSLPNTLAGQTRPGDLLAPLGKLRNDLDGLPAVLSIHGEIAIGGDDGSSVEKFSHPNPTCVGQRSGSVAVPGGESAHRGQFVLQSKLRNHDPKGYQFEQGSPPVISPAQQVPSLD